MSAIYTVAVLTLASVLLATNALSPVYREEKPGSCPSNYMRRPWIKGSSNNGRRNVCSSWNRCSNDNDCSGSKKCCGTWQKCCVDAVGLPTLPTAPPTPSPTPGTCPPRQPFDPEFCARVGTFVECRDLEGSTDCDGNQICCAVGPCGGTNCRPGPVPTLPTPAPTPKPTPGVCPPREPFDPELCARVLVFQECKDFERSSDCDGNEICCRVGPCGATQCRAGPTPTLPTPPPTPKPTPGVCPPREPFDFDFCSRASIVLQCRDFERSSDCDGNAICCRVGPCGGTQCLPGSTPTPAPKTCPAVKFPLPEICQRVRLASGCNKDDDCDAGLSCCRAFCNVKQCIHIPDNRCPIKVQDQLPTKCFARTKKRTSSCNSNEDCLDGRICCPDDCGIRSCKRTSGIPTPY